MLFIPQIDKLTEEELKKHSLSKHLPKLCKVAHWFISDADLFEREEDDDSDEIRYITIPGRNSYTFTNVSHWELNEVSKWFAEQSKNYDNLFISQPAYFPDADVEDWQNVCYGTSLPDEIVSDFRVFLNALPHANHFVRIKRNARPKEEVNEIIESAFVSNCKYFPGWGSHNALFADEEEAQKFIWMV